MGRRERRELREMGGPLKLQWQEKEEPPAGPSGKIGGGMQLSAHETGGCRRPKPGCSL